MTTATAYHRSSQPSSNYVNTWGNEQLRKHWRQAVGVLAKRGARFVRIGAGKRPQDKGWNHAPVTAAQALAHLAAGRNVGLATGSGDPLHLYAFDLDADADRGYECPQLADTFYVYRENATHKAKFFFACDERLPGRKHHDTGTELLAFDSGDGHNNCVIAGVHASGAPLRWGGRQIVQLPAETVKAIWQEWTDTELIRTYTAPASDGEASTPELDTVREALQHIDPDALPYCDGAASWIGVLAALHNTFGDDALAVADEWANGKPGEVAAKFASFENFDGKKAGVGTIYKLAIDAGWTPPAPSAENLVQLHEAILHSQAWLSTPDAAQAFKDAGVRYTTGRKILDTVYEMCAQWGRQAVRPGLRQLALRAGCGVAAVQRALPRLQEAGLLQITLPDEDAKYTTAATITPAFQNDHSAFQGGETTVIVLKSYSEHRTDDAFRNDHAAYRRRVPDGLKPLGETALPALVALLDGPQDAGAVASALGIGVQSVRRALQRAYEYGILTATTETHGRRRYALVAGWQDDLQALRRNMTSYGVQLRRELQYAETRLQTAKVSRDAKRIERAEDAYNRTAAAATGWQGADPARWVGARRGRQWLRWDTTEQDAAYEQVIAVVRQLRTDGASAAEIRRQLTFAGYDPAEVSKALAR